MGDTSNRVVDLAVAVDDLRFLGQVHLGGFKAIFDGALSAANNVGGSVAAHPGINADTISHLSSQQLVYRRVVKLTLNIPQGLVNTGDGAHVNAAAAVKPA